MIKLDDFDDYADSATVVVAIAAISLVFILAIFSVFGIFDSCFGKKAKLKADVTQRVEWNDASNGVVRDMEAPETLVNRNKFDMTSIQFSNFFDLRGDKVDQSFKIQAEVSARPTSALFAHNGQAVQPAGQMSARLEANALRGVNMAPPAKEKSFNVTTARTTINLAPPPRPLTAKISTAQVKKTMNMMQSKNGRANGMDNDENGDAVSVKSGSSNKSGKSNRSKNSNMSGKSNNRKSLWERVSGVAKPRRGSAKSQGSQSTISERLSQEIMDVLNDEDMEDAEPAAVNAHISMNIKKTKSQSSKAAPGQQPALAALPVAVSAGSDNPDGLPEVAQGEKKHRKKRKHRKDQSHVSGISGISGAPSEAAAMTEVGGDGKHHHKRKKKVGKKHSRVESTGGSEQ